MNYGLMISCKVEEKLLSTQRSADWAQSQEALAYERCLNEVLQELEVAWADGNIRIGDYILLSELCYIPVSSFLYCLIIR